MITKDDLFEGDILLTQSSKQLVDGDISFDAVISNSRKWTRAVVPYVFARNFGKDLSTSLGDDNFVLNERAIAEFTF